MTSLWNYQTSSCKRSGAKGNTAIRLHTTGQERTLTHKETHSSRSGRWDIRDPPSRSGRETCEVSHSDVSQNIQRKDCDTWHYRCGRHSDNDAELPPKIMWQHMTCETILDRITFNFTGCVIIIILCLILVEPDRTNEQREWVTSVASWWWDIRRYQLLIDHWRGQIQCRFTAFWVCHVLWVTSPL